MSDSKLKSVDKLDRRILANLLSNGRVSIANLSRNVGLSRTAVAERINRLERSGVIKGYTAQISLDNRRKNALCYLLITCEKGQKDSVIDSLKEIPEIKMTSIVGGSYDIISLIEAPDLHQLHYLCSEVESIIGIKEIKNTIVLHQPISR